MSRIMRKVLPTLTAVIVSPMIRSLETAYILFKNHPNFSSIKFIVDPDLREHIESPCDIPNPIMKTLEHYKRFFPNFKTSRIDLKSKDRNLWFLKNTDKGQLDKFKTTYKNDARLKGRPY